MLLGLAKRVRFCVQTPMTWRVHAGQTPLSLVLSRDQSVLSHSPCVAMDSSQIRLECPEPSAAGAVEEHREAVPKRKADDNPGPKFKLQRGAAKYRAYAFTVNGDEAELTAIHDRLTTMDMHKNLKFLCLEGETAPETGRKHLQGFVSFNIPKTLAQVKSILGTEAVHLEPARGTAEQNRTYCSKEQNAGTAWLPFLERGTIPRPGKPLAFLRSSILALPQALADYETWLLDEGFSFL